MGTVMTTGMHELRPLEGMDAEAEEGGTSLGADGDGAALESGGHGRMTREEAERMGVMRVPVIGPGAAAIEALTDGLIGGFCIGVTVGLVLAVLLEQGWRLMR